MPNIDFYAAKADFHPVLDYVFSKSGCRVFESYSPPGQPIAEFASIEMLEARYPIGICKGSAPSVLLQLVPPNSFGFCRIRRIDLKPGVYGDHTFRYSFEGWGLIQLYLGGIAPHGAVESHSNHFTEAGAKSWEQTDRRERGPVGAWDWRKVTATSSALNRFVRKLAHYKLGSRPVLPGAAAAFETGVDPVVIFYREVLKERRLREA
jgi:hypothetical protein